MENEITSAYVIIQIAHTDAFEKSESVFGVFFNGEFADRELARLKADPPVTGGFHAGGDEDYALCAEYRLEECPVFRPTRE